VLRAGDASLQCHNVTIPAPEPHCAVRCCRAEGCPISEFPLIYVRFILDPSATEPSPDPSVPILRRNDISASPDVTLMSYTRDSSLKRGFDRHVVLCMGIRYWSIRQLCDSRHVRRRLVSRCLANLPMSYDTQHNIDPPVCP
jgi:hypothetical protein